MTGIPDEVVTAAANEVFSLSLEQTLNLHIEDCEAITRAALLAVGLPALLERVEAAEREGCDCTELCSMGPTCPGGTLAGLDGSGCWRTGVTE